MKRVSSNKKRFEQGCGKGEGGSLADIWGVVLQAEASTRAKVLRLKHAGWVQGTKQGSSELEYSEKDESASGGMQRGNVVESSIMLSPRKTCSCPNPWFCERELICKSDL